MTMSCGSRLGHFTALSTQNVRNLDYRISDHTKVRVKGDSCIHTVFFIPIGHKDDRLQRAVDDAIHNGQDDGIDGDLLVNVRMDISAWSLLLYGQNCVKVSGDLVRIED
jgi:hypothetical protein